MIMSNICLSAADYRALSHIKQKESRSPFKTDMVISQEAQGHMTGMQQGLEESPGFSDSKLMHKNLKFIQPKGFISTQNEMP